jgi:hypothetical protein
MQLLVKTRFIDLNLGFIQIHTSVLLLWKELMNEFRENDLCSTHGLCSRIRISLLCGTVSRQLQNQEFFLLGSVCHVGLRPTDLSREPQRDIEACLRAAPTKLYHMGIRSHISRNTLANANQVRDWRIYADFAHVLIRVARELYRDEPFGLELDQTVYALDSTTVDLCLSLFPWPQFRRKKSAVKLHTLLDLRGSIPTVVIVTGGQIHGVNILDQLF